MDFLLSMSHRDQSATQNENGTQTHKSEESGGLANNDKSVSKEDSSVSVNGVAVNNEESAVTENGSVSANGVAVKDEESTITEKDSVSANGVAFNTEKNTKEEDSNVTANGSVDKDQGRRVVSDRFKLIFMAFVLHGMGTLMPWNMFITANSYFVDFKLNVEGSGMEQNRKNFLTYVGIAANVPNVLFNALNIFYYFGRETLGIRIIGAIIIEISVFLLTIILAMLDTHSWVWVFFIVTMISVVMINMASGVYQNSLYGVAAKLPAEYVMAVVFGTNVSGTFSAIILILSLVSSPNQRTASIYYFLMALMVLLACMDTYLALPLNKFYRYYDKMAKKADDRAAGEPVIIPYKQILLKVWPQCLNVFLVMFVSLTVYPAMCAEVRRYDAKFFISPTYFTPVTCFLSYNFFSMVGSFLPQFFKWPGPKRLWILIVTRFLLIPFCMFCNYIPATRTLPVGIKSDAAFSLMVVVHGLSSGYCSSLAMMYAPACVNNKYSSVAGMLAGFFLIFGVFCGVCFTFVIRYIVEHA